MMINNRDIVVIAQQQHLFFDEKTLLNYGT